MVSGDEKRQRGCLYCLHKQNIKHEGQLRTGCPYPKCRFDILDNYKSYEEFMASDDCKILVDEFFISAAGFYELFDAQRKSKKLYSDGDQKMGI